MHQSHPERHAGVDKRGHVGLEVGNGPRSVRGPPVLPNERKVVGELGDAAKLFVDLLQAVQVGDPGVARVPDQAQLGVHVLEAGGELWRSKGPLHLGHDAGPGRLEEGVEEGRVVEEEELEQLRELGVEEAQGLLDQGGLGGDLGDRERGAEAILAAIVENLEKEAYPKNNSNNQFIVEIG